MRVAFYAPMKAPTSPAPSGDRLMARLLMKALERSGHRVCLASTLRSYLPRQNVAQEADLQREAHAETARLSGLWSDGPSRPDLWFTYHNHYKAPDLLGPAVSKALGLPYVLAEASHAPKRSAMWPQWHRAATQASEAADVHLCFTPRDRAGLQALLGEGVPLVGLPPFIDLQGWPEARSRDSNERPTAIVTVAMMRAGDKLESYRLLAAALHLLSEDVWHLTIVGDGPMRAEVEALFVDIPPSRLRWTGALATAEVNEELGRGDIYAWPGLGEAYGLSYLEAQAAGLPVVALDVAGVSSVVRHGVTGLLVDVLTPDAYAAALRRLLRDCEQQQRLGRAAAAWVRSERSMDRAVPVLDTALRLACDRIRATA